MTKRKILYGYQIRGGALEIVPEEQRVVQMLFALYSAGASYQDISDALNRQGVPYSSEIPLWNKHKIKRMLENRLHHHEVPLPLCPKHGGLSRYGPTS